MDTLANIPIVKREEWGANFDPAWPSSPAWPPVYHTPYFVVIHHTATSNQTPPLAALRAVWRYHAQTQGWGDIRYHYLIGADGVIYEGRWRGDRPVNIYVEGGQSMVSNTHKVAVTLLGQFEPSAPNPPPAEPTPAALQAVVKLVGAMAYTLGLDPLAQALHPIENKVYPVISGHRDHYRTSCPGGNLYRLLPSLRQQVAAEIARLRSTEDHELTISPTEAQVAWGKAVWANLLWGDDDLYAGVWGNVIYYGLIEFTLPEQVVGGQITGMELTLMGQSDTYLRDADGVFQAVLLAAPLRGLVTTAIPFERLQNAPTIASFTPQLHPSDLHPRGENHLTMPAADLDKVNRAARSGVLAVRLEGPTSGQRLFSWDSGYGQEGLLVKPALKIRYRG
jgi:hypothetical protein